MAINSIPSDSTKIYSFVVPAFSSADVTGTGYERGVYLPGPFAPGTYKIGQQDVRQAGTAEQNLPDTIQWTTTPWAQTTSSDYESIDSVGQYQTFYLSSSATSLIAWYSNGGWYQTAQTVGQSASELTYADGKFWLPGIQILYSSTDGITWSTASTTPIGLNSSLRFRFGSGETQKYLIMTTGQSSSYGTSTDGVTWVSRNLPATLSINDVQHYNGVYYILTQNTSAQAGIYSSTDGITWQNRYFTTTDTSAFYRIVYGAGETNQFVVVGGGFGTRLVVSTDGITWSSSNPTNLSAANYGAIYEGGSYYIYPNQTYYGVSTDGVTWTTASHNATAQTRFGFTKLTTNEFVYKEGSLYFWTTSITDLSNRQQIRVRNEINAEFYHQGVVYFNNGTDKYWTFNTDSASVIVKSPTIYGYTARVASVPLIIERITRTTTIV